MVRQIFKDPYKLEFISLGPEARERDLEEALMNHITKFLLELGDSFAFMGRQYRVELGAKEFFFDLLFYHTRLHRYVVVDLKIGDFKPEYMGKMEFYLKIADDKLRGEVDEKSIGLILVKTKDGLTVEYALRDAKSPIGIASYDINHALPDNIKGELPSIAEIEESMETELNDHRRPVEKRLDLLKKKLAAFNNEQDNTIASAEKLTAIYDNSLQPLFEKILDEFDVIANKFIATKLYWSGGDKPIERLEELRSFWTDEGVLRKYRDLIFTYHFYGFKKAGLDSFNTSVELQYNMSEYFYGFKVLNERSYLLRKSYSQQLTVQDMQVITDALIVSLIDRIERNLQIDT